MKYYFVYFSLEFFRESAYDRPEVRKMIENFGGNVARLRKEMGLSQTELAEKIGVQKQTISNIERGIRYPTFESLEKFATVFHATPIQLFGSPKEIAVSETTVILDRIDEYDQKVQNLFTLAKILNSHTVKEIDEVAEKLAFIERFFTPQMRLDEDGNPILDRHGKPEMKPVFFDNLPFEEIEKTAKDLAFIQEAQQNK